MTCEVVIHFEQSRVAGGEDIAAIVREGYPQADVTAELDGSGALSGYVLRVPFPDQESADGLMRRLQALLERAGIPWR